ncbi:uncharacterized protein LOC143255231 isoform X4 [Tachypleus tridentatus]|uniref:uncharacterized protein LOC143255231 isoform X4 n=1 Tax=Tachypleus tridentatus TaxID=6853 RepID=UPI003FD37447
MTVSMSDFQWQKHAYFARYQSPVESVVKVYFRIKETVIYSSTPKYQTQDILSAIGSQTGLWLGISIISTFQTIMHLIQRISNHCNNRNIPVTTTLKPPGRNKSTLDDAGN